MNGCTLIWSSSPGFDVEHPGADVVLLALGEPEDFSGESQSRTQIVVPAAQQRLAEAVAATGKPTVVLLRTGRGAAGKVKYPPVN